MSIIEQALQQLTSQINENQNDYVRGSADVQTIFKLRLMGLEREEFHVMLLNTKNQIISVERMFSGTIDEAAIYPREVARHALLNNAKSVIIAHNHPSGDAEPSRMDKQLTTTIKDGLKLLQIDLLDHIIIAGRDSLSFAESLYL